MREAVFVSALLRFKDANPRVSNMSCCSCTMITNSKSMRSFLSCKKAAYDIVKESEQALRPQCRRCQDMLPRVVQ